MQKFALYLAVVLLLFGSQLQAADVVLPNLKTAYYAQERIELAISGLEAGAATEVKLTSDRAEAVSFQVTGDGGTVILALAPYSLAPGKYSVTLGDEEQPKLTFHVSRGVWPSRFYVSQTGKGYQNIRISNAFNFGTRDRKDPGMPTAAPRTGGTLKRFNELVEDDIPALIYMYWTGYVTHKPWGIHKEWASADMIENMRLFNYHVAQRLRRYDHLIYSVGSLDEPGLPWGRTASGGSASAFTGWNVADWLKARDFDWTDDPGSLPEATFRRYMELRALMLREAFQQANADIKEVWPTAVYATDSYAPQAVGDGTDPMNQIANDIPTTHVFADYGIGKLGVLAGMYVEKAHDPTSKIAHAMNGQLFGYTTGTNSPNQLYAYHLMMNVMLAAGLDSNWWLNQVRLGFTPEGKSDPKLLEENLEKVNEPAARIGPLFHEVAPSDHDVAVLWSNTEIWMRVKSITQAEASNADGKQMALMVADMPEDAVGEDGKLKYNAYSVGGNYKDEVMSSLMAVNRAGYPAHVLHEELIPAGKLDTYKVLVMVHQTHELPVEKRAAIEAWIKAGGTLIQDASCTVKFAGAMIVEAPSVVDHGYAWKRHFKPLNRVEDAENPKTDSYFSTNHFMESHSREAAPIFRAALAKTAARPAMRTDTVELACERHVGGEAQLLMVINGYESLPEIPADQFYKIWNYAPYEATYSLPTVQPSDVVYEISGHDWRTVQRVANPTETLSRSFLPGEMKLYLVLPKAVTGLSLTTALADGCLTVDASTQGQAAPLPVQVTVTAPNGETISSLYRTTDATGTYRETIPLGRNAPLGAYTVRVESPIADLKAEATETVAKATIQPTLQKEPARVFDGATISAFLAKKPAITIAVANEAHRPAAEALLAGLQARGIQARIAAEDSLWRKAMYPRVWDPYVNLYRATDTTMALPEVTKLDEKGKPVLGEDKKPVKIPGEVTQTLNITSKYYETPTVTTSEGEEVPLPPNWNKSIGTLLTVVGDGYVQIGGAEQFFEPGTKIFIGDRGRQIVVNGKLESVKTDDAFRAKWQRPWQRIVGHVGGYNLTPQLPECYEADDHLILLGDSQDGTLVRALQASELLLQVVDEQYPGPGKAVVQYAWSPFALHKNVIYIGATDASGLAAGVQQVLTLAPTE